MSTGSRRIWGWMAFDWANQPFQTVIVTFVFGPWFVSRVAENAVQGQAAWGYAVAAGSALVAISAPVLGAVVDARGPRKPWIAGCSLLYIAGAAGLWLAVPGMQDPLPVLAFLVLALIGAELATVLVNSLLPELGARHELGRISGSGWAFGLWGGVVALVFFLAATTPVPGSGRTMLGLVAGPDLASDEGARAAGPFSALWYVLFMTPFFAWCKDVRRGPRATAALAGALAEGLGNLKTTLAGLPSRPSLLAYLLASMFYRDAIMGIVVFGGIYGAGVLGLGTVDLLVLGIVVLVSSAVGSWAGGLQDARRGPKPVILFSIVVLSAAAAMVMTIGPNEVLFLTVGPETARSPVAEGAYYVCSAVIGATAGALQAASRTLLVRLAERGRMAEAFGLFALAGKSTAFIAPLLIALATDLTGSQRVGVVPVLALLAAGFALMGRVRAQGDGSAPARSGGA